MGKVNGCRNCYFYSDGSCLWFETFKGMKGGKPIPNHIISKGCNLYMTKIVGYILEKFEGEFI